MAPPTRAAILPTLIVHSHDDKTHVVGSKVYHAALLEAQVAHEFCSTPLATTATPCTATATPKPGPNTRWLG